jgi:broad specificity phosphatase PhoE
LGTKGSEVNKVLDADALGTDRVVEAGARLGADLRLPVESFLFLRHGRTSANHLGIIQGQKDVPLDAVGRAQAQAAADLFRSSGMLPARIVSSDLSRAAETARILARALGMKVESYAAELRERHFGTVQGTSARNLLWHSDPPGAETIEAFVARCRNALQRHLGVPRTLIVAHGGVLRATAALLGEPLVDGARANAVPLSFKWNDRGWQIKQI